MQINNFKKLQEEEEKIYIERHEERVRTGLLSSLGVFRFVGQVVDMYLPKVFDLLVLAMGGRSQEPPPRTRTTPPSQAPDRTEGNRGPGGPSQDDVAHR